jgi:hypothetical protein
VAGAIAVALWLRRFCVYAYPFSRLCFKATVIEPLQDNLTLK